MAIATIKRPSSRVLEVFLKPETTHSAAWLHRATKAADPDGKVKLLGAVSLGISGFKYQGEPNDVRRLARAILTAFPDTEPLTYREALAKARKVGAKSALGFAFLAQSLAELARVHAISPAMAYSGAVRLGLGGEQVLRLAEEDPSALGDLQFLD